MCGTDEAHLNVHLSIEIMAGNVILLQRSNTVQFQHVFAPRMASAKRTMMALADQETKQLAR